jgi:hypothetical protein
MQSVIPSWWSKPYVILCRLKGLVIKRSLSSLRILAWSFCSDLDVMLRDKVPFPPVPRAKSATSKYGQRESSTSRVATHN